MESTTQENEPPASKCILHLGEGDTIGDIKLFSQNDSIWQNMRLALQRRMILQKKTKYDHLLKSIPEYYSNSRGYHSNCLKNFTAVPCIAGPSESSKISTLTRSQVEGPSTSSSGVLPPICIFCNQIRKKVKHKVQKPVKKVNMYIQTQ